MIAITPRRRAPAPAAADDDAVDVAGIAAEVPSPRLDIRAVELAYARLFATPDGQKVLAHLKAVTFMRAAPPDAPDNVLRHMEGQRALLAAMLRLIERGRNP